MMTSSVSVDAAAFNRAMEGAVRAIVRSIDPMGEDLAASLAIEGGAVKDGLGAKWKLSGSGLERKVTAPVFWAHWLARGTRDHGPQRSPHMTFPVSDGFVSTDFVRGITATHFDEKAIERTEGHLEAIITRALATEGVI